MVSVKILPTDANRSLTPVLDRLLNDHPQILDVLGESFAPIKNKDTPLGSGEPNIAAFALKLGPHVDEAIIEDLKPLFALVHTLLTKYTPEDFEIRFVVEYDDERIVDIRG